ncbi:hypothetical protein [Treponema sp. R6D11]
MNVSDLIASLDVMWKGVLGLFAVCIFIMLLVMVIYRVMAKK